MCAQPKTKNVKVSLPNQPDDREPTDYRNRYALLIGINHYDPPFETLDYPELDVDALHQLLANSFAFTCKPLVNGDATKQRIETALTELEANALPDDAVLIYFAGHGLLAGDAGYLLPTDSKPNEPDSWLPVARLIESCEAIQARRIFVIIDMCHAGTLMSHHFPPKKTERKSIHLLAAGTAGQIVPDKSVFAEALRKGLSGYADTDSDDCITAGELMAYVKSEVEAITDRQVPLAYDLVFDNISGGQFRFIWKTAHLPSDILRNLDKAGPDREFGLQKLANESLSYDPTRQALAIEVFLTVAQGTDAPALRQLATTTLGALKAVAARPLLRQMLAEGEVAAAAAGALGRLGWEQASEAALVALLEDGAQAVEARAVAAQALADLNCTAQTTTLLNILGTWRRLPGTLDPVWDSGVNMSHELNTVVVAALTTLAQPAAVENLLPALLNIYQSEEDNDYRAAVGRALRDLLRRFRAETVPGLLAFWLEPLDYKTGKDLASIIAELRLTEALPPVRAQLDLLLPRMDQADDLDFMYYLGELILALPAIDEDKASIPVVADLLGHAHPYIAAQAAEALGNYDHPDATAALIAAATGRAEVATTAIEVLGQHRARAAFQPLIDILTRPAAADEDPGIRSAAADALGRLGVAEAAPTLVGLLGQDTYFLVVKAAAQSLVRLEGPAALLERLVPVLDNASAVGKLAVLAHLLATDHRDAVLETLTSPEKEGSFRAAVMHGLAQSADYEMADKAVHVLSELKSTEEAIRIVLDVLDTASPLGIKAIRDWMQTLDPDFVKPHMLSFMQQTLPDSPAN